MSVINKTNKNYKRSQKGRSMVEMLGVLAIVGVLSVGGVYGYGVAMKKHKANELLHQASMLATTISAQIQSKGELPTTIENFGDGKYGTFNTPTKANDEQFEMKITGIDPAVCEQMEKMTGGMVRQAECDDTTLTLTYNNNLSSDKVAADYNSDEDGENCEGAGYKWCSELSTPACKKDCCSGITLNSCQESCDSDTGKITNKEDETDCTTADDKKGTCNAGECVETPTCLTSGSCMNNEGLCEDFYCSIENYTSIPDSVEGLECGDGRYIPGEGSVRSLDTLQSVGNYKLSSRPMMSWDAAVNYCDALKRDGLVTYGRLADYDDIENVLNLNLGVEGVWIGKTCQFSCNSSWCDRSAGDTAFYAISVKFSSGAVDGQFRASEDLYALCE